MGIASFRMESDDVVAVDDDDDGPVYAVAGVGVRVVKDLFGCSL